MKFFLSISFFVLCTVSAAGSSSTSADGFQHGLSVSVDGQLLLKGKPYRAVGVNYFSGFLRTLSTEMPDDTSYRAGFRYLSRYQIPFIRFSAGGYWPSDWQLYLQDKAEYFRRFDAFVKSAEEYGIGLIPSLFWHFATIPDIVGEPVNEWGNPQSDTRKLMKTYLTEVVLRYRDSPAIWGWEFGNEYNLEVDLPGEGNFAAIAVEMGTPASRTMADRLTSAAYGSALIDFASEIRKYDPYRIIISGNSNPRPSAWHLKNKSTWDKDAIPHYSEMLDQHNPAPLNTFSIHLYPDAEGVYFEKPASLPDLVSVAMEHAVAQRKPLFIGEFGAQELKLGVEAAALKYRELVGIIREQKVPLSAVWVFDYPPHDEQEGINIPPFEASRTYMLEAIRALNLEWSKEIKE